MTIDHAARDFSRPYAASSDEGDRGETGSDPSDRPAIAMTIVAASRPRAGDLGRTTDRWRLLAEAAVSLRNPLP